MSDGKYFPTGYFAEEGYFAEGYFPDGEVGLGDEAGMGWWFIPELRQAIMGEIVPIQGDFNVKLASFTPKAEGNAHLPPPPFKRPDLTDPHLPVRPSIVGAEPIQVSAFNTSLGAEQVGKAEDSPVLSSSRRSVIGVGVVGAANLALGGLGLQARGSYFAGTEEDLIALIAAAQQDLALTDSADLEDLISLALVAKEFWRGSAPVPEKRP